MPAHKAAITRHYTRSSSFKMALLFSMLCGAAVTILGYFVHYFDRGHVIHGIEATIDADIKHLRAWDRHGLLHTHINVSPANAYLLTDSNGTKIAGTLNHLPASVSLFSEGVVVFELPPSDNPNATQTRQYAAKIHTFDDQRKLLVGFDITATQAHDRLMQWLSVFCIVFMAMVIMISYLISRFVATRTNHIARTAKDIMLTGDLSRRIDINGDWDDLSHMAGVLNHLLERIEQLLRGVHHVSDNIAHDLRTPLTRLRNHLESLSQLPDIQTIAPIKTIAIQLIHEADQLLNTFNALLRIARIEAGQSREQFTDLKFNKLIQDVVEFYEPLAEEKNLQINHDIAALRYYGDRDLLFQSVANLLDNAIKFTPDQGTIMIVLQTQNDHIQLTITDSGPGINDIDKDKIFKRFYRSDNSRNAHGNGLGLSLVAAVIELHHGNIVAHNTAAGFEVRMRLPHHQTQLTAPLP